MQTCFTHFAISCSIPCFKKHKETPCDEKQPTSEPTELNTTTASSNAPSDLGADVNTTREESVVILTAKEPQREHSILSAETIRTALDSLPLEDTDKRLPLSTLEQLSMS